MKLGSSRSTNIVFLNKKRCNCRALKYHCKLRNQEFFKEPNVTTDLAAVFRLGQSDALLLSSVTARFINIVLI